MSGPDGRNSPYQGGAQESGSARAINHPTPRQVIVSPAQHSIDDSLPSPVSVDQQHRSRRRHQLANQPLGQHLNQPLRRHEWMSGDRKWTPSGLEVERRDFFDTRVTGRQEIWQAIHAALELMWEADTAARNSRIEQQQNEATVSEENIQISATANASEQARQEALTMAQTILSAAEITIPTGDLANGVYDSFGNFYGLPEQIVADPINIALTSNAAGYTDAKGDLAAGEDTAEEEEADESDKSVAQRREEKGKAVVDERDQIALKARLSEGDQDVDLSIGRGESVRSVARRIAEEAMLASNKHVRLAYMGKVLAEGSSLLSQGWKQGHVINALVFTR